MIAREEHEASDVNSIEGFKDPRIHDHSQASEHALELFYAKRTLSIAGAFCGFSTFDVALITPVPSWPACLNADCCSKARTDGFPWLPQSRLVSGLA